MIYRLERFILNVPMLLYIKLLTRFPLRKKLRKPNLLLREILFDLPAMEEIKLSGIIKESLS